MSPWGGAQERREKRPTATQARKDVEGSLFLVKRRSQPRFQFIILNKKSAGGWVASGGGRTSAWAGLGRCSFFSQVLCPRLAGWLAACCTGSRRGRRNCRQAAAGRGGLWERVQLGGGQRQGGSWVLASVLGSAPGADKLVDGC